MSWPTLQTFLPFCLHSNTNSINHPSFIRSLCTSRKAQHLNKYMLAHRKYLLFRFSLKSRKVRGPRPHLSGMLHAGFVSKWGNKARNVESPRIKGLWSMRRIVLQSAMFKAAFIPPGTDKGAARNTQHAANAKYTLHSFQNPSNRCTAHITPHSFFGLSS